MRALHKVFTACHSSHLLLLHSFPLLRDKAYFILFFAAAAAEKWHGVYSFRWRCLTQNVTVSRAVAALDLSGSAWQCQWESQASVLVAQLNSLEFGESMSWTDA